MKNGKILIIDDNEDVLFALNLLLEPYVEQIKVTTQPERIEHLCRYGKGRTCHKGGGYRLYSETLGKRKTACYSLGSLETA